jgi:hypothetical protein
VERLHQIWAIAQHVVLSKCIYPKNPQDLPLAEPTDECYSLPSIQYAIQTFTRRNGVKYVSLTICRSKKATRDLSGWLPRIFNFSAIPQKTAALCNITPA